MNAARLLAGWAADGQDVSAVSIRGRSAINGCADLLSPSQLAGGLSVEEIALLFEVAGGEDEAIRRLDDTVALLHRVQHAKAELRKLSPAEQRKALELRAALLRGASA